MKDNWANLPHEILLHIFRYLAKKDFKQLQFTNKAWSSAAKKLFYEELVLRRSEEQVALLLRTLEASQSKFLPNAVRNIYFDEKAFPNDENLRSLIKMCPNIATIDFPTYNCKLNPYILVSELRKEGHLQRLQKLEAPDQELNKSYQFLISNYEDAMLCLASTATELRIDCKSEITGLFPPLANHLADFVALEKLKMQAYNDDNFSVSKLGNMLSNNKPPQLRSFNLTAEKSTPSRDYPANVCYELAQVKNVTLVLHTLSAQDLCYLMCMFPNVQTLIINPLELTAYLPRSNNDKSRIAFDEFSKYISQIAILELWGWMMSPEVTLESIASLAKLNNFNSVDILIRWPGDEVDEVELKVRKSDDNKSICDGEGKAPCNIELCLDFEPNYHMRLIKALLVDAGIRYLTIDADQELQDEIERAVNYGACLGYILAHCKTLEQLSLSSVVLDLPSNSIATHQSDKLKLHKLTLANCEVNPDAFTCISHHIGHIDVFKVYEGGYDYDDNVVRYEALKIDMPFTVLDAFVYSSDWDEFAVKIISYEKIILLGVSKEGIQILADDSPYASNFASDTRNFHTLTLCCNRVSRFSVEECGSIIVE